MNFKKHKVALFSSLISILIIFSSCTSLQKPPDLNTPPSFAKFDQSIPKTESPLSSDRISSSSIQKDEIATREEYPLSLEDAIVLTLENNLDIKISNYDSKISTYEVEAQKGIYDTSFRAKLLEQQEDEQTSTDREKVEKMLPSSSSSFSYVQQSHTRVAETAISQLLPSGAWIDLTLNQTRVNFLDSRDSTSYDPFYTQTAGLSVTQPLLKGFGKTVTNAGINISRINKNITTLQLKKKVMDQITEVLKTYWDLVFSIENLEVQKISLKQAEDLLRINTIKYESGALPSTDVLQAKAQVAAREEQVLIAKSLITTYQDRLKQLMNIPEGSEKWLVSLTPKDSPIKKPVEVNEAKCLKEAMALHPDIISAKKAIEIAEINLKTAKNMKQPELNIFGSYGYSGKGNEREDAFDNLTTYDYVDWQLGLEFKYPFLNRQARYKYYQSEIWVKKAETQLKNVKNLIALAVRDAIRSVNTNLQRTDITKTGIQFEEAKLAAEQNRFDVGKSTSFNILTFQQDLALAKVHHLSAVIDYNKALVDLEQAKGTILDTLKIKIEESPEEDSYLKSIFKK